MKVDGLDIDVGVEGVLVEEDCTTCVMGHMEAIREKLVVNVVRRFLQSNDMPHSCNLFFDPVVAAESPLHNRTGRKAFTGTVHVRRGSVFSLRCLAKLCCSLLKTTEGWTRTSWSLIVTHEVKKDLFLRSQTLRNRTRSSHLKTAVPDAQERD